MITKHVKVSDFFASLNDPFVRLAPGQLTKNPLYLAIKEIVDNFGDYTIELTPPKESASPEREHDVI